MQNASMVVKKLTPCSALSLQSGIASVKAMSGNVLKTSVKISDDNGPNTGV